LCCCCCRLLLLLPAAVEKFTLAVLYWGQKNLAATPVSNDLSK
jgi:hypothetical protein